MGEILTSWYQKELFTFKYISQEPKNKESKLRQTKKDKIKEASHLNYTIPLKYISFLYVTLFSTQLQCCLTF